LIGALWRLGAKLRTIRRYGLLAPLTAHGHGIFPSFAAWLIGWTMVGRNSTGQTYGENLAGALVALGPSYIKLGQILATRADIIGFELADSLGSLNDNVPPFDQAQAEQAVEAGLGMPLAQAFQSFGPAIASASIAQVHFAVTSDGDPVAVKVLRPGIEAAMARDLSDLAAFAQFLETWVRPTRRLRPMAIVDTLRRAVAIELDLRMEGAACAELGEIQSGDPDYRVPQVDWRRTAKRVLTLSRVEGLALSKLDQVLAQFDGPDLARKLVHGFLRQAMLAGFFHADPHPGNLFVAPDGALIAVDFGIMGRLSPETSRFLALILKGFVERDYRAIAKLHMDAGYVGDREDIDTFAQALRAIGESVFDRPAKDISMGRLMGQLFEVTAQFNMQTQPQLLMLQKTMVVVEGVSRRLDPELNMFETARPVIEEWLTRQTGPEAVIRALGKAFNNIQRALTQTPARFEEKGELSPDQSPAPPARPGPLVILLGAGFLIMALLNFIILLKF
jgi:ubiquinone biosynthesis protein